MSDTQHGAAGIPGHKGGGGRAEHGLLPATVGGDGGASGNRALVERRRARAKAARKSRRRNRS